MHTHFIPTSTHVENGEVGMGNTGLVSWLKERISYVPEAGQFTAARRRQGTPAGGFLGLQSKRSASVTPKLMIEGSYYRRDQLVWLFETGEWQDELAPLNGDRFDTRFRNLWGPRMTSAELARHFRPHYAYQPGSGSFAHTGTFDWLGVARGERADYFDPAARRWLLRGAPRTVYVEELLWLQVGRDIPDGYGVRRKPGADFYGLWVEDLVCRRLGVGGVVSNLADEDESA